MKSWKQNRNMETAQISLLYVAVYKDLSGGSGTANTGGHLPKQISWYMTEKFCALFLTTGNNVPTLNREG